ncbi:hypothetical protein R1flu_001077 [Riccia fluitans]|uniref:Uncharacterized protein n=1 Tax=Riccia fluitans TaxID=41844 RepID=A0ABD1Y572_9MARC
MSQQSFRRTSNGQSDTSDYIGFECGYHEDPSSPPPSQIVPVPTLVDLTQYASSSENEGLEDQGWPRKEDLTKADLESTMSKRRYLWEYVINMYTNEAFLRNLANSYTTCST